MQKRKLPELRFKEFKGEWESINVDNLVNNYSNAVNVKKDISYEQIGIRSHGKGLFYKEPVKGVSLGNKRVFWIKENMLIINIVFAWERAIAKTTYREIGKIASHRFPMYQPRKNISNLDFLLYLFLTKKGKYLLTLASPGGAGRNKTLGKKEFGKLILDIPTIDEQQKIVSFLSKVDEKIEKTKKKKGLWETYKKGMMQKIFSQEIRFKDDDGEDYPDWMEKKLGEIGKTYNGLTGKTKEDFGKGKPFITYKSIFYNNRIDVNRFGYVSISETEKQNKVQYGDIFFTTSSETPLEVGMSSVLLNEIDECYLNGYYF